MRVVLLLIGFAIYFMATNANPRYQKYIDVAVAPYKEWFNAGRELLSDAHFKVEQILKDTNIAGFLKGK